ncbi:c-type cytochrome [Iodobacter ciconiae]|uniref:Cytochrome c n=1 Tax=Iodobacter ciconiae TaxID=2496266 RepID=A0A3S8ZQE9_9NEIS|nr:cytochrome c [Iodobacter ciconiae]AZN35703.1 cytochrome c [Iodobacter ciconiae]
MKSLLLLLLTTFTSFQVLAIDVSAGKAVYEASCSSCHMANGEGLAGAFPPLNKSDYFKKASPAQIIKIIDQGLSGEITVNGQKYTSAMPPQNLTDQEIADVLNYVSVAMNNGKPVFKVSQVKKLRIPK